ncbi:hypothetical protein CTheo_7774 [Ceratobasidium theobromae]|uniref:DHHA2 domain-containing protein n=1 Tax=Ceratobasidium theobromae TaxID=1582974 RepID=A0A5N5QBN5_9AGAM|nr:hypothetical protein CTheo_7774 [Ceratobasidium theobromae]
MHIPSRRVALPCLGFALVSFLMIASTMTASIRVHLKSKFFPYLRAPFASTTGTPITTSSTESGSGLPLTSNMSALSAFLSSNKRAFLADLASKYGEGWTIVMGNEAGDLDSCASAIAFSYLSTTLDHTRTVALIQTPRADLFLREENLLAFRLAHLDGQNADLLTLDDITSISPSFQLSSLRTTFALVDHNRILPQFLADPKSQSELDRVVAIFDHHDDEGFHKSANPREIRVPTGSCASIVADYFRKRFPRSSGPEDAISQTSSLLISAIAIDTGGLKEGGKAEPLDRSVSEFLYPISSFGAPSIAVDKPNKDSKTITELTDALTDTKRDVSHLSGRDLLRRDYKESQFTSHDGNSIRVGLSTVPVGLNHWIDRDGAKKFWAAQDAWIKERNLDISGVLTTFRTRVKGKHKREMLLVFPSTGAVADAPTGLELKLYAALEANQELEMERKEIAGIEGRKARAWQQRNKQATRKTIAPLLKSILEE